MNSPSDDNAIRQATVTASGVARMAGVGRAAVSNWRRRHSDFPTPVGGTSASPVFDGAAVEQWLQKQGKFHSTSTGEWLWRHIENYQPVSEIGDALCLTGTYLLTQSWQDRASEAAHNDRASEAGHNDRASEAGHNDRASEAGGDTAKLPSPQQLRAALRERSEDLAELLGRVLPQRWTAQQEVILHTAHRLAGERDPGDAFEFLHAQFAASSRSLSGQDATPEPVTDIMLGLAGAGQQAQARIFDFTSGTGSILRAAAAKALESGSRLSCFGQELKPQHALTTLLRLWFVHDRAVKAGFATEPPIVSIADSLLDDRFRDLKADMVVANPPFGIHDWGHEQLAYDPRWTFGMPPRTEPELAWVQHALAHLAPGGTAVMLMPPAAAARPAGRRIRGELIRRGALQAVIALPPGMLPPIAIGLHLWVLSTSEARSGLLFVDCVAALPQDHRLPPAAAGAAVRDLVTRAWLAYRSGAEPAETVGCQVVAAIEVLDDEVDLTPRRYVAPANPATHDPQRTLDGIRDFTAAIDQIRQSLPSVSRTAPAPEPPTAEIADLLRSASLSVHRTVARGRGDGTAADRLVEAIVLTGYDVVTGGPPTGRVSYDPQRQLVVRVEPGDILIPVVTRELVARVANAAQAGAELGPSVHLVRVDPDVLDPWFIAGVLSRPDNARVAGRVSSSSAGALRIDIRRLSVPVLPIAEQRRYGNAFRQLAEFEHRLARATDQGTALARAIAGCLAAGTLAVE